MKNCKAYLKGFAWGATETVVQAGLGAGVGATFCKLGTQAVNEKFGKVLGVITTVASTAFIGDVLSEYAYRVVIPKLDEEFKRDNFVSESPCEDVEEF